MNPDIKICGIKSKEEIHIINQYPVKYIGFIFAESVRQVTREKVMELRNLVRKDIKTVGVFVNEKTANINDIIKDCKIDIVQLHGNEDDKMCEDIKVPVWKSISIKERKSLHLVDSYSSVSGILLDTYSKTMKGGTGNTFNWDLVKDLSKDRFTILAGGLNPDNIYQADKIVNPHVLDVNSGVETNYYKDNKKIEKLFLSLETIKR